jgi:rubrerythrin
MKMKAGFSFSKLYRSKNKIPIDELEIGQCQNCGFEFRGHYCPDCGQEVAEFNRPGGYVF